MWSLASFSWHFAQMLEDEVESHGAESFGLEQASQ
jgi:hypothetical protein